MESKNKKSHLIIDGRMRKIEKEKLKELGYNLIEIKPSKNVYEEISAHVDIFTCQIGNKVIIEPTIYEDIKEKLPINFNIEKGSEKVESKYPYDIKYNVAILGKKAIHSFEFTEPKIKKELKENGYELINTTQGYTNCSIAIIDENTAIVTDKGLYKILQKYGIEVLYLQNKPDIKLLTQEGYSLKSGFIGGTIARIDENVIVFGDLNKIDEENKIRNFIKNRKLNLIEFKCHDVMDYGGILLLK